jgi:hypothetical protein
MKKNLFIICFLGFSLAAFGQFKDSGFHSDDIDQSLVNHDNSSSLFGFLNSNDFKMSQSYSLSYSTFGSGQGMALGVYTNNMMFKLANNLNIQLGASVVNSPYSTFGKDFQKSINGIYLTNAELNYKPFKDVSISVQYRQVPFYSYNPFMGGFYGNDDYFGGY